MIWLAVVTTALAVLLLFVIGLFALMLTKKEKYVGYMFILFGDAMLCLTMLGLLLGLIIHALGIGRLQPMYLGIYDLAHLLVPVWLLVFGLGLLMTLQEKLLKRGSGELFTTISEGLRTAKAEAQALKRKVAPGESTDAIEKKDAKAGQSDAGSSSPTEDKTS